MANASNILKDDIVIKTVCYDGKTLKIKDSDDEVAKFLKNFINKSGLLILNSYHTDKCHTDNLIQYRASNKRIKSCDLLELKVNHYRQLFWYWKPL